jgi:hypothetical protein
LQVRPKQPHAARCQSFDDSSQVPETHALVVTNFAGVVRSPPSQRSTIVFAVILFVMILRARDRVDAFGKIWTAKEPNAHHRVEVGRDLGSRQRTVFETSLVFALSAPVESSAVKAKYQVPGVRFVVNVVVLAPDTFALDE